MQYNGRRAGFVATVIGLVPMVFYGCGGRNYDMSVRDATNVNDENMEKRVVIHHTSSIDTVGVFEHNFVLVPPAPLVGAYEHDEENPCGDQTNWLNIENRKLRQRLEWAQRNVGKYFLDGMEVADPHE
jgi:hypothetical protein